MYCLQVVLSGNWKFFSGLHVPIDVRVGISNDAESFVDCGDLDVLQPGGQLPSILAPDGAVSEMVLRIANRNCWSITYPLPAGGAGWNKPRILMEVCRTI